MADAVICASMDPNMGDSGNVAGDKDLVAPNSVVVAEYDGDAAAITAELGALVSEG